MIDLLNIFVIYEDTDLIAVTKPSGITVNKADTTKGDITLQDWVEKRYSDSNTTKEIYEKEINGTYNPKYEFFSRGGIVHRLDKETSGVILIAKNVETFIGLQKQFKERTTEKSYLALAHGKVIPLSGQISVPVGRLPFNRMRFGVIAGGREALTFYQVVGSYSVKINHSTEPLSLVKLNPKTGRTHQIRVHLKYINHPVFSDPIYAGRKVGRNDRKLLNRLFLHAATLTIMHPRSNQTLHLESSLPEELTHFLTQLTPLDNK